MFWYYYESSQDKWWFVSGCWSASWRASFIMVWLDSTVIYSIIGMITLQSWCQISILDEVRSSERPLVQRTSPAPLLEKHVGLNTSLPVALSVLIPFIFPPRLSHFTAASEAFEKCALWDSRRERLQKPVWKSLSGVQLRQNNTSCTCRTQADRTWSCKY